MFDRVLFIGPHADDCELACGGTMSRLLEMGKEVFYLILTTQQETGEGFPKGAVMEEAIRAAKAICLDQKKVTILDYPVRRFSSVRQDILDELVRARKAINPDIVFVPSTIDVHQDHEVTCKEAIRAFKECSLLGYEHPRNQVIAQKNTVFFSLRKRHMEAKMKAVDAYKSQHFRKCFDKDLIISLAKLRGSQTGTDYAEAFEPIRLIYKDKE
jgi:LmbE family N-acetylglucosaminyl deacetylase